MKRKEAGRTRVTSADVARASGVSRATVSYVLNNDTRQTIPSETRDRVLKAAQKLGYSPFAPARILRAGYSQLVLAVLPFVQIDPAIAGMLKELEMKLAERGLTLISSVGLRRQTGITHPSSNVTPGVILSFADERDPQISAFLRQFQVPVLSLLSNESFQQEIGELQASHLIRRGRDRLVFVASEREDVQFFSQNRLKGVIRTCAQWKLELPVVCGVSSSRADVRTTLSGLLTRDTRAWGMCCYNDEVAFAVIAALTDEGLAIPEDVAVIGCDDIPLAPFSIPPLTTIHFDREESLDLLVETLVATSHGTPPTDVPQATLSVIERLST